MSTPRGEYRRLLDRVDSQESKRVQILATFEFDSFANPSCVRINVLFHLISVGIHTGPIPEWSVREQLILASAVQRSGDQNWYARG